MRYREKSKGGLSLISFEPLRNLLEERKISTYYLRNKCGKDNLDSKTIQRIMSDESVSTNTLNSLCNILNCDISEIISYTPDNPNDSTNKK